MLASSSRVQLRSAREATFGSEAAATGRRKVRMTGESFNYSFQFDDSKEIRSDRQVADQILLGASAAGGFNFELAYKEYDEFFEDALQDSFASFAGATGQAAVASPTFAANTLTQTGGSDWSTIPKGAWVAIAGLTGASSVNNGVFQTSLTVAPTATVLTFEGASVFTYTGAGAGTCTLSHSRLTNGVTQRSRLMEVEFADIAQFLTFRGMTGSKLSLDYAKQAVLKGSFDFVGADAMDLSATSNIPGTDAAGFPTVYDVVNTSKNLAKLYEAGAPLPGTFATAVSLSVDNALRAQTALANLAPVGCGSGTLKVTGKLSAYFANATLYDKFTQNQSSSVAMVVKDAAGNGYAITVPALEFINGIVTAGQRDQDVMVDLDFAGKIDTLSGKMLLIDRFGAAV